VDFRLSTRYFRDLFSPEERRRRDTQIAALVNEAATIALSSESAAADLHAFYPAHARKAEALRFAVTPFALTGEEPARDVPEQFFLVCNQFWKHKKPRDHLRALRLLRAGRLKLGVLCTGQLDDYRDRAFVESIRAVLHHREVGAQASLLGIVRGRNRSP